MSSRQPTDALHLVRGVFEGNDIDTIFGPLGIPATEHPNSTTPQPGSVKTQRNHLRGLQYE
jgi:hypothetical protein